LDSNQVTKDGRPPLSERNGVDLSTRENEIHSRSPIHDKSQPVSKVRPQSPVPEHAVSPHVQDPTPQRNSGSDSQMLRVLYLLEKGGGMPHLGKQIIKVPEFEGVSIEEFLDDISKLKRKYSYALPWKLRTLPLIKRRLTHQTT